MSTLMEPMNCISLKDNCTLSESESVSGNGTNMSVSVNVVSVGGVNATPILPEDKRDHVIASNLLSGWLQVLALTAIVKLGIPDILSKAPEKSLTLEKIVSQIDCKNPATAISMLKRVMRFMVYNGIFSESKNEVGETQYALNGVAKMFVASHELSTMHWCNFVFHNSFTHVLAIIDEAITKDICPWEQVHGMPIYALNPKFPELGDLFDKAMVSHSNFSIYMATWIN